MIHATGCHGMCLLYSLSICLICIKSAPFLYLVCSYSLCIASAWSVPSLYTQIRSPIVQYTRSTPGLYSKYSSYSLYSHHQMFCARAVPSL